MFRNDSQRAAVCDILTRRIRGIPLWAGFPRTGPTKMARLLLREGISSHEMTMLHFAWTIWNGRAMVKKPKGLNALSAGLDGENLRLVGSLLCAMAGTARDVDAWIAAHHPGKTQEPTSDYANEEGGLDW